MNGSTAVRYPNHIVTIHKVDGFIRNNSDPFLNNGTKSVLIFFMHNKHDVLFYCSNSVALCVTITVNLLLLFLFVFLPLVTLPLNVALLMAVMALIISI